MLLSYDEFREKAQNHFDFSVYDGFATSKTTAIWSFDFTEADKVYPYLYFTKEENVAKTNTDCADIKVVITGKLQHFKNRDAFKECINLKEEVIRHSIIMLISIMIVIISSVIEVYVSMNLLIFFLILKIIE